MKKLTNQNIELGVKCLSALLSLICAIQAQTQFSKVVWSIVAFIWLLNIILSFRGIRRNKEKETLFYPGEKVTYSFAGNSWNGVVINEADTCVELYMTDGEHKDKIITTEKQFVHPFNIYER